MYVLKSYVSSGKPKVMPRASGSDLYLLGELTKRSMPSIPSRNESYGYEKTPDGALVLQKPLKAGFAGTQGDSVGPGDYDPPILASVVRKVPAAVFSKVHKHCFYRRTKSAFYSTYYCYVFVPPSFCSGHWKE